MFRVCVPSFIILNISMVFFSVTKDIRIHNVTEKKLYAAMYDRPVIGNEIIREGIVVSIDPLAFSLINRPSIQMLATRHLAVSESAEELSEIIDKDSLKGLCSIGVGSSTGARIFDNFYVVQKHNTLKLYDPVSLKISDIKHELIKNIEKAFDAYRFSLAKYSPLVIENTYKNQIAQVRISDQLCDQEEAYLALRIPKIKKALEDFLETDLNGVYVPKIAFINSGGGIRSLISCTGFHVGAQEIGLLDAVTYDVGLSGGAWFVGLWMQSGLDIYSFKKMIRPLVQKDLMLGNAKEARLFADALLVRFGLKQPVTLVNSWGALIANRYLLPYGGKRQQILWSDVAATIKDGSMPFPILSATSGTMAESSENRPKIPWFEFTPFEVGSVGNYLGNVFVPTWAFGRTFKNGYSLDTAPELDLGGIMGICGSAFAFSFARGYEKKIKDLPIIGVLGDFLLSKVDKETVDKKRFSVGKARNFARGISGAAVSKDKNIRMVDGGIAFNLPYPPVSGHGARKADVFIFFDASSNVEKKGPENLHMIQKYAKEYGLKFPHIDTKRLAQKSISVFKDESDPTMPLVIYMPRSVVDDVAYPSDVPSTFSTAFSTAKFAYTEKEFDALSAVTQANIMANKKRIKEELLAHIMKNGGF